MQLLLQVCPQLEVHKKPPGARENWQGWERICNKGVCFVLPGRTEEQRTITGRHALAGSAGGFM